MPPLQRVCEIFLGLHNNMTVRNTIALLHKNSFCWIFYRSPSDDKLIMYGRIKRLVSYATCVCGHFLKLDCRFQGIEPIQGMLELCDFLKYQIQKFEDMIEYTFCFSH